MFVTVVEAGSFSAAARRLKPGQPAVSKSIAQFDEHLNARLALHSMRGLAQIDARLCSTNTRVVLSTKRIEQRGRA